MLVSAAAFDAIADAHDRARWSPRQSRFDSAVWEALNHLADCDCSPGLFLGCGSAREALPFACAKRQVTLVDYSARMVELAKEHYRGFNTVEYRQQCAVEFLRDCPANTYGYVSCVGELLAYLEDPETMMKQVRAVLTPGGTFVFSWVDGAALVADTYESDPLLRTGGVIVREREAPPLEIAAWSQEQPLALLASAGFVLHQEIKTPDSPRRCWIAVAVSS